MEENNLPKPPKEHHCCECGKKVKNALCEECEVNLHLLKKKCVNFDCCTHYVDDENAILCTMCTKKQPQMVKHFQNGSGSTCIQPDSLCQYDQPTTSIVPIDDANRHVCKCVRCNRTVYAVVCNVCHVKRMLWKYLFFIFRCIIQFTTAISAQLSITILELTLCLNPQSRLRSAESPTTEPADAVNAVDCKRKEPVENEDLSPRSISPLLRWVHPRPVPRRDKESNTSDCLNCQAPNAPLRDEIGFHLCSFCLKAQE